MKLSKKNIILLSSALVAFVGILILIILLSISCNKKTTQIELNKTTYTFNNTHSTHVNATVTNPIGDTT
jgi:hypothetical protein